MEEVPFFSIKGNRRKRRSLIFAIAVYLVLHVCGLMSVTSPVSSKLIVFGYMLLIIPLPMLCISALWYVTFDATCQIRYYRGYDRELLDSRLHVGMENMVLDGLLTRRGTFISAYPCAVVFNLTSALYLAPGLLDGSIIPSSNI